jgi:hypothetical protein
VLFEGSEDLLGALVDIQIERANGFSLYGTPMTTEERVVTIAA